MKNCIEILNPKLRVCWVGNENKKFILARRNFTSFERFCTESNCAWVFKFKNSTVTEIPLLNPLWKRKAQIGRQKVSFGAWTLNRAVARNALLWHD